MFLQLVSLGLILAWAAIVVCCAFGWQLLRQNGRLLLRFDELEKRLDEMEFGGDTEHASLPLGALAPNISLPDLAGQTRTLADFRGQSVLLIFFNPACGFCRDLLPKLAALSSSPQDETRPFDLSTRILIVSTGDAEFNRQLFNEHKVSCPVILQKEMEVAAAYKAIGTPSGYLISPEGKLASVLAIGTEALLEIVREPRSSPASRNEEAQTSSAQASSSNGHSEDQSLVTSSPTNRFKERSLARSKIKRDGLKAGMPAPDFRLPRLDGRGELSLSEFRGKRVLLVFSSPNCGPCNALAPELEKFHRANRARQQTVDSLSLGGEGSGGEGPQPVGRVPSRGEHQAGDSPSGLHVIMISKGEPKENRTKVKEHDLTFPIVLQQQWEISRRYAMFATPIAYLIDEAGGIAQDVAVGIEAIQTLCDQVAKSCEHVVPAMI